MSELAGAKERELTKLSAADDRAGLLALLTTFLYTESDSTVLGQVYKSRVYCRGTHLRLALLHGALIAIVSPGFSSYSKHGGVAGQSGRHTPCRC